MRTLKPWTGLCALVLLALPFAARAAVIFPMDSHQQTLLQLDPSVRAAAMGDVGTALWWGDEPGDWANPALLGSLEGARYEQGERKLDGTPYWHVRRTSLGWGGIGIATSGLPAGGLGDIKFGMGSPSYGLWSAQRVRGWSVGLSVARVIAGHAERTGHEAPTFTRWADLQLGYAERRLDEAAGITDPLGSLRVDGRAIAHDFGVMARGGCPLRLHGRSLGRFDAAYAFARMNENEPAPTSSLGGEMIRTSGDWRHGVALRAALDGPRALPHVPAWFACGLTPLVSLGWAMDLTHSDAGTIDNTGRDFDGWGGEMGLANVLFLRLGQNGYASSNTATHTHGFGVGLPFGRFGAVRYDRAFYPKDWSEAVDAWSVRVNPIALWQAR